jgi:hypothetical protein
MSISLNEIRKNAVAFAKDWQGEKSERAEAQSFWNDFFAVFGLERKRFARFEKSVERAGKHKGRIDLFWPKMLMAEHKSAGENLDKAGVQAFEYLHGLKNHEMPRYIIVSDFTRFRLFDLDNHNAQEDFLLEDLPQKVDLLSFMAGYSKREYKDEDPINVQAALRLGDLSDALEANGFNDHELKLAS